MVHFRAELESQGGTTAGFEVPESVVTGLGGGGRPKVVVRVNGFTYRNSIARMGGRYLLGVSNERRVAADIAVGQTHDVEVELDTAPREAEVPDDLAVALAADPEAQAFFASLSFSKQQWHTTQVSGAKTPETRARRIAASVAMLHDGRAR